MLVGQLLIGTLLGLGSAIFAYLALDVSIWLALAIYSGMGAGAALYVAASIVLFMHAEQPDSAPAGPVRDVAPAG